MHNTKYKEAANFVMEVNFASVTIYNYENLYIFQIKDVSLVRRLRAAFINIFAFNCGVYSRVAFNRTNAVFYSFRKH